MALSEEQIATRMANLAERFADRLPAADLKNVARYRDVGEWLLTVQALLGALRRHASPVSTREREELHRYLTAFATAAQPDRLKEVIRRLTDDLAELTEVPSLSGPEARERARTLPEVFGERIPDEDRWELTDAEEAQDWADLTEATVALLRKHRIPVSPAEHRTLWLLLDAMDLPTATLAELTMR